MNFIDTLKLWDTNMLLFINGLHTSFFDGVMYSISEKMVWIPFYLSVVYVLVRNWKREAIWIFMALVLCIVIADQVSSSVIKDLVQRPRPSHAAELNGLVHLVNDYAGGRFGFVSSHAANAFGFALLSSLLFNQKKYTITVFIWAAITAYSRMYLGVHYPLDILGGTLVGLMSAFLCFYAIKKLRPSLLLQNEKNDHQEGINTLVPIIVLSVTFFAILIYSFAILNS